MTTPRTAAIATSNWGTTRAWKESKAPCWKSNCGTWTGGTPPEAVMPSATGSCWATCRASNSRRSLSPVADVWHLFVVLVKGIGRGMLAEATGRARHRQRRPLSHARPLAAGLRPPGHKPGDFPVAEDVMRRCLSLPMFAEMTEEQIEYVAEAASARCLL